MKIDPNKPTVLIPKDIKLSVVPVRRTIKWTDEEGIKHVKRNQLAVKVVFTGEYENEFHAGDILFDWKNNQKFIATSKNTISNLLGVAEKFDMPKSVVVAGSTYFEKQ